MQNTVKYKKINTIVVFLWYNVAISRRGAMLLSASGTIYLTISALIYMMIIIVLFLIKKKVDKVENRIFKKMLLLSIISMITELAIVFTSNIPNIGTIVQKVF